MNNFLDICNQPVVVCNEEGIVLEVNPIFYDMLKIAQPIEGLAWQKLASYIDKEHPIDWHKRTLYSGHYQENITVFVGKDSFAERHRNCLIKNLLVQDELTGLGNLFKFQNDMIHLMSQAKSLDVMLVDINEFKGINDCYGFRFGNACLKNVAKGLSRISGVKVYRWSGDHFMVVGHETCNKPDRVMRVIQDIKQVVSGPIMIDQIPIDLSCCIGVVRVPQGEVEVESIYQYADIALNLAKEQGSGSWYEYHDEAREKMIHDRMIYDAIGRAIVENQFELYYQPIFSIEDRSIHKLEVLLRWPNNPVGEKNIGKVIEIAEKSELIYGIDQWVIQETFKQIAQCDLCDDAIMFSINVSAKTFYSGGFVERLIQEIQAYELDLGRIEIEITEHSLLKNIVKAKKIIKELQSYGVKVAMDDFGTKYSSLSYLCEIPFDTLKLDKSYIDTIVDNKRSRIIVKNIIQLAGELGLDTIAEGIEIEEQLALLRDMGAKNGQGYLISPPLNKKAILNLLFEETRSVQLES